MSLAHQSHPELEYFRPFLNFLRKAGIAVALISVAVIGGALVLRAGHDSMPDMTSLTGRGTETPPIAATTPVADRATAPTAAEKPALPEASAAACEQDTWAYLDGKCIPAKTRKPRNPRAATDSPLGRTALPPKLATGANAAASSPEAAKPTGQSNAGTKKARKTAANGNDVNKSNSSSREERGRDERWSARAYAAPDGRNPAGPYERSWGWTR